MPIYEYLCDPCGAFAEQRPLADYAGAHPCPRCGTDAPRAILTPPRVAATSTAARRAHARNERAVESPQRGRIAKGAGAEARSSAIHRHARPKSGSAPRPWMLSH